MARGPSGRIVIDAGEELKNRLYTALAYQGISVKEWFCRAAEATIEETNQPFLIKETQAKSTKRGICEHSVLPVSA
jgi:hypothetical protein